MRNRNDKQAPHVYNYKPAMGVTNSKQRICPFVGKHCRNAN